jgi:hypothetical protein
MKANAANTVDTCHFIVVGSFLAEDFTRTAKRFHNKAQGRTAHPGERETPKSTLKGLHNIIVIEPKNINSRNEPGFQLSFLSQPVATALVNGYTPASESYPVTEGYQ